MGCGPASAFRCENDLDCVRSGQELGTCEPVGYCSFPDDSCASGQRFGEFSDVLGGKCVQPDGAPEPGGESMGGSSFETGGETLGTGESGESSAEGGVTSAPWTSAGATSDGPSGGGDESTAGDDASSSGEPPAGADLVLWLDFEGGIADKSTYDHTVSCSGSCPTQTAGVFGDAGAFEGGFAVVEPHAALNFVGPFTLSLWFRVDEMNAQTKAALVTQPHAAGSIAYDVSVQDLDGDALYDFALAAHNTGPGVLDAVEPSAWTFLVIRAEAGQQQVFLDGEEIWSGALGSDDGAPEPLYVGGVPSFGFLLGGAMDDVRLYRRALDEAELATVMNGDPLD